MAQRLTVKTDSLGLIPETLMGKGKMETRNVTQTARSQSRYHVGTGHVCGCYNLEIKITSSHRLWHTIPTPHIKIICSN